MSIIADVERKSTKNKIILSVIYFCLTVMGLTMIVPFLITLTGSASDAFDYNRYAVVPRYLYSVRDRFVKCLVPYFDKTRGWQKQLQAYAPDTPKHWTSWSQIGRDTRVVDEFADIYMNVRHSKNALIAADYAEFTHNYPMSDCFVSVNMIETVNFLKMKYSEQYRKENPDKPLSGRALAFGALGILNREWGIPYASFYNINFDREMRFPLDFQTWFPPTDNAKYKVYNEFKEAIAAHMFTPGIKGKWLTFLEEKGGRDKTFPVMPDCSPELRKLWLEFKKQYAPSSRAIPFAMRVAWLSYLDSEEVSMAFKGEKFTIETYNKLAGTDYLRLEDTPFPIPEKFPLSIQKLWNNFLMDRYPLRMIRIVPTPELNQKYREQVRKNVKNLSILNKLLGTSYKSWEDLTIPAVPESGDSKQFDNRRDLWKNFVKTLPVADKKFYSSEKSYQEFLLKKYGSLHKINRAYKWNLTCIEEAFPPLMAAYAITFEQNSNYLTFAPVLDSYQMVWDFMTGNGNAILVTLILIVLTLAFTLTINPLAAYALSRFNLRGRNQILVFMLATMAFPAMVSAIPAYLLMRDIGLLNTFWALVLPGAANGMAIFILKGFFDSLPMELFEAATIDGASEMQIFRIVAMPMVKPILAINCLNAFIAAYNGWAWALLICQDKEMWTIAVWLYQASTWWSSSPWIVSAGFIVASVPTFLVFISCQKIILRGIIIPTMK